MSARGKRKRGDRPRTRSKKGRTTMADKSEVLKAIEERKGKPLEKMNYARTGTVLCGICTAYVPTTKVAGGVWVASGENVPICDKCAEEHKITPADGGETERRGAKEGEVKGKVEEAKRPERGRGIKDETGKAVEDK